MRQTEWKGYTFAPEEHESELLAILEAVEALPEFEERSVDRILRRHPKNGNSIFSRGELIAGYRFFAERYQWPRGRASIIEKLRMKPVRSLSGVTPVTILTKPFPCPGKCIFCPNDVKMPKSYISREPGAQRAGMHQFDPYDQTLSRLDALYRIGHPTDKVELIVLGGTWSFYSEPYQIWFLTQTFEALNDFGRGVRTRQDERSPRLDFEDVADAVDGRLGENRYNGIVADFAKSRDTSGAIESDESATWDALEHAQRENETAGARCVGLSLETRPDYVTEDEVLRLRRLGATKIQIGYQSLSDEVLDLNQRGHDVAASRKATKLLRQAGFKIQAHWMANLYGSTPEKDVRDFKRLFSDPDFRPDELKLYPCSLIESAELMVHYEAGRYRPYEEDELLELLIACMTSTPVYCRLSRVIRDIPGDDIHAGSRVTNFRAVAESEMERRGLVVRDIRAREIRKGETPTEALRLVVERYRSSIGEEAFIQFVTPDDHIAGFLRLCLPETPAYIDELAASAIIREVHVYGAAVGIGKRDERKTQHSGLGGRLIDHARTLARANGFERMAVISSIGTREYYRRQGFSDGILYQHRAL